MNVWFTADQHLGHANIIKYTKRPFKDTKEMDDTIIDNYNSMVEPDDMVYILGDFCFGKSDYIFDSYFNRLKGVKILVRGNHDGIAWKNKHKFYAHHIPYHEINIQDQDITLCHYAMRVWNKSHYGAWNLYGHSHGSLPDDPHARAIDVGVDCHNFTPINFDQIKKIMEKKHFIPVDHHTRVDEGGIGLSRDEYAKMQRKTMYLQLKKEFEP